MGDWRADLCRESYAAFQRLDADAALPLYDPDCEWDVGQASAALGQTVYRGHQGVRDLMNDVREVFPDWHPVVDELRLRQDGRVLVRGSVSATASGHPMRLEMPVIGQVIEFRDRRIARIEQTAFPPSGWDESTELT